MIRIDDMKLIILCIILIIGLNAIGFGQTADDARYLSMAGSNVAIAEGNEYYGGNPATLAVRRDFNFEIQLLSAHLMVRNNSFSLNEYDQYFTTGDSLSRQDIDNLFSHIPEKGLYGYTDIGARALSFYSWPFSITVAGIGNGFVNLPKDPIIFPFYGNTEQKVFSMDDLDGEAWAGGSVNFAVAYPLTQWMPNVLDFFSVGISPKYIVGFKYAEILESQGNLITTDDYILADAHVKGLVSSGGNGFGLDLGILGIYDENWTFSLHASNLFGFVNWGTNDSLYVYDFVSDSVRLNDYESFVKLDKDTSYATGRFRRSLPQSLTFATAYQYLPNLVFTTAWRQGLNKALGNSITPLISIGTEYSPIPYLPLRTGLAVGGNYGFTWGMGFGIDLKYWQLSVGYMNHNFRWFRSARSMDFALTTQFRF